jgi:hypothetical protein
MTSKMCWNSLPEINERLIKFQRDCEKDYRRCDGTMIVHDVGCNVNTVFVNFVRQ